MKRLMAILLISALGFAQVNKMNLGKENIATQSDGKWFLLKKSDLENGAHHTKHAATFDKYVSGYNSFVLKAIDIVQATAMDGGGYFTGKDSIPTESPIGYDLALFGHQLIDAPRKTSYCSSSSYAAFIEALNLILPKQSDKLDDVRLEAMRMQEPNGGRREDGVKNWGYWNADGFGTHFSMVQYTKMGDVVSPIDARPGDFLNISWKGGLGHSVVFLGWYIDESGKKFMLYWSSQKSTNGLSDQLVKVDDIKNVKMVRLTHPENLFNFDVNTKIENKIPGDEIGL
ncbi:MAG: hypothetical protein COT43_03465 [Candidatus Marinimicrobia bacterium CG08_land_8_20_14_0_20_45_22]|nr:MAG: hypothetical protein COT43_03465 [Candidatus Marinimicrobia bacterium CG08_land_8_20_14_0_20_45_22]